MCDGLLAISMHSQSSFYHFDDASLFFLAKLPSL